MTGWGRGWGFVVGAAALSACGPPPVEPTPGPSDATAVEAAAAVEPTSEADEPFRAVLAALAGGSARAVREFVPSGGRLLLYTNICEGPLGRVRCREHETDAERRRVVDEVLAPWQGLLGQLAAVDPGLAPATLAVRCVESVPRRWSCSAELALGINACGGDREATIDAVLLADGADWWLERLGLAQEILVCE